MIRQYFRCDYAKTRSLIKNISEDTFVPVLFIIPLELIREET